MSSADVPLGPEKKLIMFNQKPKTIIKNYLAELRKLNDQNSFDLEAAKRMFSPDTLKSFESALSENFTVVSFLGFHGIDTNDRSPEIRFAEIDGELLTAEIEYKQTDGFNGFVFLSVNDDWVLALEIGIEIKPNFIDRIYYFFEKHLLN